MLRIAAGYMAVERNPVRDFKPCHSGDCKRLEGRGQCFSNVASVRTRRLGWRRLDVAGADLPAVTAGVILAAC